MGLFGSDSEDEVSDEVKSLIDGAEHDSVTAERLTELKPGKLSRYLHDKPLIDYLDEGEQPHFILAARGKAPTAEGSTPDMPEQFGTGMVMHMITDERWLTVASNSEDGDQPLDIPLEQIVAVDRDLGGHNSHTIELTLQNGTVEVPIANLYDDEDVEAACSYLEDRLPEHDGDSVATPQETDDGPESEGGREEEMDDDGLVSSTISNAKKGVKISKLQKYLGQDAMNEYTNGPYETPEEYIRQETPFDSWSEFITNDGDVESVDEGDSSSPEQEKENDEQSELDEKDYDVVKEHLDPDEEPQYILKGSSITIEGGNSEDRKGSLTGMARTAVTERRVLTVVPQKILGEDTKSVPYEEMGGVDFNKGLVNKYLKFQSHGRTYKIHTTDAEKTKNALNYIRQRKQELDEETQSSGGSENDPTEQLKNLKELHDQGVITDEEFEEKKSDLLDRI